MLFQQHATLAADQTFRTRIQAAIIQHAIFLCDPTNGQQITNEITRAKVSLARSIIDTSGQSCLDQFAWVVAGNGTILQAYAETGVLERPDLDNDISYVVEVNAWDVVAGRYIAVPEVPV